MYEIYSLVQSGIKRILKLNNDTRVGVEEILKIGSHWYSLQHIIVCNQCSHVCFLCSYAEGIDGEEYKKMKWSFNMILFIVVYELTFKKVANVKFMIMYIYYFPYSIIML